MRRFELNRSWCDSFPNEYRNKVSIPAFRTRNNFDDTIEKGMVDHHHFPPVQYHTARFDYHTWNKLYNDRANLHLINAAFNVSSRSNCAVQHKLNINWGFCEQEKKKELKKTEGNERREFYVKIVCCIEMNFVWSFQKRKCTH